MTVCNIYEMTNPNFMADMISKINTSMFSYKNRFKENKMCNLLFRDV